MLLLEGVDSSTITKGQLIREISLRSVLRDSDIDARRAVAISQINSAASSQTLACSESPRAELWTPAVPAVRRIEKLVSVSALRNFIPITSRVVSWRAFAEYALHRVREHAQRGTSLMDGGDDGMLLRTRILMLVAHHDRMSSSDCGGDHWMTLQQRGDPCRQFRMTIVRSPDPACDISRQAESSVVGTGNTTDETVDRAHLDTRSSAFRAVRKDRTRSVGVRED